MTKTAVYYHENAVGEILYVGCSQSPSERFAAHRSISRWVHSVANIRISWFDTRQEALAFERAEINRLKPKHNAEWKPRHRPNWCANEGQLYVQNWARKHGGSVERLAANALIPLKRAASYFDGLCHPNTKTQAILTLATDGFVPQFAFDRQRYQWCSTPKLTFPSPSDARRNLEDIFSRPHWAKREPVAKMAALRNSITVEASQ